MTRVHICQFLTLCQITKVRLALHSLPNNKILDSSKLKEFANDNFLL